MDVDAPQDTTAESHPVTAGVTPVGGAGSTKDQHRHKLVKGVCTVADTAQC